MADNQDPLAALQKLLADQQKTNDPNGAGDVLPGVSAPTEADGNQSTPVEVVTGPTAEEIATLEKAQAEKDKVKIEEQLLKMKTELQESPQYQARMSQKQASEAELAKKRLEERSKRIFQLKHLEEENNC